MILKLDMPQTRTVDEETPAHVNPMLWQQSLGLARQIAARVFRDNGSPVEALAAVGVEAKSPVSWDKAVEGIAEALSRSTAQMPRPAAVSRRHAA